MFSWNKLWSKVLWNTPGLSSVSVHPWCFVQHIWKSLSNYQLLLFFSQKYQMVKKMVIPVLSCCLVSITQDKVCLKVYFWGWEAGEHERAAKEKTSKAAQWNENSNGFSKPFKFGPTALMESRALFLWYLGTGPQEFQTFAMYHLLSPTDSCKASLLLFPKKIGLHIVWLVVFLLFFCFFPHPFVLQPQPSSS